RKASCRAGRSLPCPYSAARRCAAAAGRRGTTRCSAGTAAALWRAFLGEHAMAHQHAPLRAEGLRQLLGEIYRAVAAAGAADGDGDVAAVLAHALGQPVAQQALHVVEPALYRGIAL